MSFVFDWDKNTSEFVMWDAKTMDDKPVFSAPTKARVPHGFHTFFVPEVDLE
jgi:carotenoid cleavage dioxygenase-like enzyme